MRRGRRRGRPSSGRSATSECSRRRRRRASSRSGAAAGRGGRGGLARGGELGGDRGVAGQRHLLLDEPPVERVVRDAAVPGLARRPRERGARCRPPCACGRARAAGARRRAGERGQQLLGACPSTSRTAKPKPAEDAGARSAMRLTRSTSRARSGSRCSRRSREVAQAAGARRSAAPRRPAPPAARRRRGRRRSAPAGAHQARPAVFDSAWPSEPVLMRMPGVGRSVCACSAPGPVLVGEERARDR